MCNDAKKKHMKNILLPRILTKHAQKKQREEKRPNHMNEEMNIGVYPSIE